MKKETEEETYNKVLMILGYDPELSIQKEFDLAKLYASERLKLSIPSEQEIGELFHKFSELDNIGAEKKLRYFIDGNSFKKAVIELLTKGQ